MNFTDPDGDLNRIQLIDPISGQLVLEMNVETYGATSGIINFSIEILPTAPVGSYAFAFQALDQAGNLSNRLQGVFTITPGPALEPQAPSPRGETIPLSRAVGASGVVSPSPRR